MKICPDCNNMIDSNLNMCPYCGRNVIGVTDFDPGLGVKGQVVDEELDNKNLSQKIYTKNMGIRSIEKYYTDIDRKTEYILNFKKLLGIFASLLFIFSIISDLETYKLVITDQNSLYRFIYIPSYSLSLFALLYLNVMIKKKIFIIFTFNISFFILCFFKCNPLSFNPDEFKSFFLYILLLIPWFTSYFKKNSIRIFGILIPYLLVIGKYVRFLKGMGMEPFEIFSIIKPLTVLLSISGINAILFHDFIFFLKNRS